MSATIDQFRTAIQEAGITPPDVVETDGRLHRFGTNGKVGDDAGWYVLHTDGLSAGAFGDFRLGVSESWRANGDHKLSPREQTAYRERMKAIRREHEADMARRQAEARKKAKEIWQISEPAIDDHPYLARKGVKAHGLRVAGDGRLVVPVTDGLDFHSLQFIPTEGKKRFLTGGRVRGCYYLLGKPDGILCIAEGFATAASVYEATGHAAAVAFGAGSLLLVAKSLRTKYSDLKLIICADDDPKENGSNPGMKAAQEAAREVDGALAVPDFGNERPEDASDFNDLHQHVGAEAVCECFERAERAVLRTDPVTAAGLLDAAGIVADLSDVDVDAVAESLRQLGLQITTAGVDALLRATVRVETIARLKTAGIPSPTGMVDAALCVDTVADDDSGQGRQLLLTDPEPWDEPVDGADLLAEVSRTIVRYVILPEGAETAVSLWIIFAHAHDVGSVSPLLAITSPTKRCGKTTMMMLLNALVPRPLPASNITGAVLFRAVEAYAPTLLIDEGDTFLKEHEELRGILNCGHTRAMACTLRCDGDGHEPRIFSTWCPKVVAMIGSLPDTLSDRSVIVPMRRKAKGEHAEKLRLDKLNLEPLRSKVARWSMDNVTALQGADPDVPSSLDDRAADNWRPLLAIADAAGGAWPKKARKAAVEFSGEQDDDGAAGTLLLGDLQRVFDDQDVDRLTSAKIVEELVKMEERPWPEWRGGKPLTQTGLALLLGSFSVRPQQLWIDGAKTRGYNREGFGDAWSRYLAPDDSPSESFSERPPVPGGRTGRTRPRAAFSARFANGRR